MPAPSSTFSVDLIYLLQHPTQFDPTVTLGLTYGTNLFKGQKARLPDGPGPFVTIYRTGGHGAEGTHNSVDEPAYEQPSGQLVVRGDDYDVVETKMLAIHAFMWPLQNVFINGTWWRELNVDSEPFDLPLDEKGRVRQAFNISSVKRVSPSNS
jgi:hypothetical protein